MCNIPLKTTQQEHRLNYCLDFFFFFNLILGYSSKHPVTSPLLKALKNVNKAVWKANTELGSTTIPGSSVLPQAPKFSFLG